MIGPLWIPPLIFFLRFILGYRIDNLAEIREQYRQLREESDVPAHELPALIKALNKEMQNAAKKLEFEQAAELRDRIRDLEAERLRLG